MSTSLVLCEMDLSKKGEMCAQYDGDAQDLNDKLLVQQQRVKDEY